MHSGDDGKEDACGRKDHGSQGKLHLYLCQGRGRFGEKVRGRISSKEGVVL